MLNKFEIAEINHFNKRMQLKKFTIFNEKIRRFIYPQLRDYTYFGNNIKKLKDKYENVYQYRIGNIRLFYTISISEEKVLVLMLEIMQRKDSYK